MNNKIDFKILLVELKSKIKKNYPYFLGFYLLSLLISVFSSTWKMFFYWPAFHGFAIFFTILFFGCFKLSLKKEQEEIKKLIKKDWLKILIIITILIFALFEGILAFDFLILLYGLISFLFILNSRYAAMSAFVFLILCPIFLAFKKDVVAESLAVYCFYFLVITVFTSLRELKRDKTAQK